MTPDMNELVGLVEKWGEERHIDNPYRQLNKVLEEVGEIAHEVCRDRLDSPEFQDSIGDALVTIIILGNMTGNNVAVCLEKAFHEISNREGITTSDGMFIKDKQ